MRLIQCVTSENTRAVGLVVDQHTINLLNQVTSTYQLAQQAIDSETSIEKLVTQLRSNTLVEYADIINEGRILAPIDMPDPAHLIVSGTGLTHLGSADTRDEMHAQNQQETQVTLTDTKKTFNLGLEGGKPAEGETGVQPEWFYKGNGHIIVNPEGELLSPAFALDAGEEPEIAGIYINDKDGNPCRIGFALGNEFSDHKTEQQNYLYLAHSKLRPCAIGPELLVGELPNHIEGVSRIIRNEEIIWEKAFLSGEDNMSHSIANLEYHHFKYPVFCQAGETHLHFFGTATLSFGDGIQTQAGDIFEIESAAFGRPLRNTLKISDKTIPKIKQL